jgi:hypothetical protein
VHFGLAEGKRERRAEVLAQAYAAHPERFVRGVPSPAELPREVWINKPVAVAANGLVGKPQENEIVAPGADMEVVFEAKEELVGVLH